MIPRLLPQENRRKIEPEKIPNCLIPHLIIIVVFTWQLKILVTALQHEPAAVMFFANNSLTYLLGELCFSGNVVRADINLDSDHKSKGFGTVQFETATEAINAVCILSMNTNKIK